MKSLITYSILAAAATSGLAFAAQTAYTTPVGYVTQALPANALTPIGLTLHPSAVAAGSIDTVAGALLTDAQAAFAPVANRLYILEITSGSLAGTIQEIVSASITPTTITTPTNLGAGGLTAGTTYKLRLAPTLEEIFGTGPTSSLTRALSSGTADIVWVPTGTAGGYEKYFVHSGTSAFRRAGTTTPTPNVPVTYVDGLFIQKKATASSLVITGEVKTGASNSVLPGFGLSPVSIVAPAGLTLKTAGFDDDFTKALSSGSADVLWVPTGPGVYAKYYVHSAQGWRSVSTNTNVVGDPVLPNGVLVQRKSGSTMNLDLLVPAFYSNL